jgi:hypothetical protein
MRVNAGLWPMVSMNRKSLMSLIAGKRGGEAAGSGLTLEEMAERLGKTTLEHEAAEDREKLRVERHNARVFAEAKARKAARIAALTPGGRIVEKYADQIVWGDRNNNLDFIDQLVADIDAALGEK